MRKSLTNIIIAMRIAESPKQSTPNRHNERSEVSKGRESKKLDSYSL